ncbi:uncharacterized protein LOC110729969 [Chenopodium quinoa]|uniref:uncharacterized protein LOC110729969 n=1 Tax=Chenopodium quinoa TaxID=63459 RepID=UPI000B76DF5E|nr:uncharacterized protein LOC110729969 [Chenopodium quinoa]
MAVDNVSKWFEAIASPANDHKVVMKLFKKVIFLRFDVPKAVISDKGSHFIHNALLKDVVKVWSSSTIWPSISSSNKRPIEVFNRQIKGIPEKMVARNQKDWSENLDDSLWGYRMTFKTPIGTTPYLLVYGKSCHLPVELEHRSLWAIKKINFDLASAGEKR